MKTHLFDSEIPAQEGSTLTAICGAEVRDAAFASEFSTETLVDNAIVSTAVNMMVGLCRRCKAAQLKHRYIYAICSGEENLRRGGEAADV